MGWAKALFSSSLLPVIEAAQVYRAQSLVRFYWKKEFFDVVCVCVCVLARGLSRVWLFCDSVDLARHAPLSGGFPR